VWRLGEEGNNEGGVLVFTTEGRVLEEDGKVCEGDKVSTSLAAKFLTESGVAKPKVGC
jgi:hypothetical protein